MHVPNVRPLLGDAGAAGRDASHVFNLDNINIQGDAPSKIPLYIGIALILYLALKSHA